MGPSALWLLFVGAALLAAVLTPPLRAWLMRRQMLDLPDPRRSHREPTPRGGGLAIVAALFLAWLLWPDAAATWWPAMGAVLAMALVGWLDDRYDIPALWRFTAQLAAAVWLTIGVGGIPAVDLFGYRIEALWLWSGLGVLAAVWLINLYNFMDGSDGIAAGQALWVGLASAALFFSGDQLMFSALALAAAGAWGGFLLWNRPPARVFMGDVGSLSLGAVVSALALMGAATGSISIWVSFMLSSLFVVDATATLVRRVIRGERWYTPHRQHAYQRLLALGWSHGQVLVVYALINVLVVLPVVVAAWHWPRLDTLLAAGLAALLAVGWQVVQSAATLKND